MVRHRNKPLEIFFLATFKKKTLSTYIWNEANFIEMVAQLWVMKCNHLGKHCQIFWNSKSMKGKKKNVLKTSLWIRLQESEPIVGFWTSHSKYTKNQPEGKNLKTLIQFVVWSVLNVLSSFPFKIHRTIRVTGDTIFVDRSYSQKALQKVHCSCFKHYSLLICVWQLWN